MKNGYVNNRRPPKIIHQGIKIQPKYQDNGFYQFDPDMLAILFDNFTFTECKYLITLIGNSGTGKFGLTENEINRRTGLDRIQIWKTKNKLKDLKILDFDTKNITVFLNRIWELRDKIVVKSTTNNNENVVNLTTNNPNNDTENVVNLTTNPNTNVVKLTTNSEDNCCQIDNKFVVKNTTNPDEFVVKSTALLNKGSKIKTDNKVDGHTPSPNSPSAHPCSADKNKSDKKFKSFIKNNPGLKNVIQEIPLESIDVENFIDYISSIGIQINDRNEFINNQNNTEMFRGLLLKENNGMNIKEEYRWLYQ